MEGWMKIETAPTNETILVLYQSGDVELIKADDNDYEWQPCPEGPKKPGIDRPELWHPIPRAPARKEGQE